MKRKLPYLNTSLTFEERVNDLVSRMTPQEKLSQMVHSSAAIPRLGIPKYDWWNECLHGVARAGIATLFPQAIGLAATFDDALVNRVADAISDEGRAKHHEAVRHGFRERYYGINFWSPNINIFRDPRWGRGHETYGEDPYLTSRMGVAFVKGIQGNDPKYLKAAACAKHLAVHSGPEADRHHFNAVVTEKDLYETYLPAFKALVQEAGVETVMGAYNRTLGEPCCASERLLTEILRGEWGFKGHVVSDCHAIHDIYLYHKYTKTAAEAAALSTRTGCDMNCCLDDGSCSESAKGLDKAYRYALLEEGYIDIAVKRILMTRFKLGMFDPEKEVKYARIPFNRVDCAKHRKLSLQAARESLVLLKNDGVLPLKGVKKIGVLGPNADDYEALVGNYNAIPSKWVTPLQGIRKLAGKGVKVSYMKTCGVTDKYTDYNKAILDMFRDSDVIIAVMGLNGIVEGEEGAGFGDRTDISLPAAQQAALQTACSLGKPVVAVMMTGSSISFDTGMKNLAAIIQAWYPGQEGGTAVAEALFGKYNPGGRLPVTFYRSADDLPDFRDYNMKGRTYRYFEGKPLFPFGYGLSYTKFRYSKIKQAVDPVTGSILLKVKVTNTGKYDGDEVVQAYMRVKNAPVKTPIKQLVAFKRVHVKKGGSVEVMLEVKRDQMGYFGNDGKFVASGVDLEFSAGPAHSPAGR